MTSHSHANRRPRFTGILGGLTAVAGGALVASIGQLATAPSARADLSDLFDNVSSTIGIGQGDLSLATTDANLGLYSDALGWGLGGFNDLTVLPAQETALNGVELVAGNGDYDPVLFVPAIIPPPADIAAALADVQDYATQAQAYFSTATSDFAVGNVVPGLDALTAGADYSLLLPADALILGVVDSLLPAN